MEGNKKPEEIKKEQPTIDFDKLIEDVKEKIMSEVKEENLKLLMSAFAEMKKTNEGEQQVEKPEIKKEIMDF